MSSSSPDDLSPVLRDTLRSAFGATPIGVVAPVRGGASGASTFRIEAGRRHYMVRMEGAASPLRNPHQYESMRLAAEAGVAPPLRHVDETARVVIMDFIETKPLKSYPGGPNALARALAEMLRRLQATPGFPQFVRYPGIVERLFAHVRRTGLFAAGILDPHVERLERLREAYASGATRLVSSHNDLIPSNILFDGERLWLVDWESAYRNDPLVDVATILDTLATSPELEEILL